ncbi:unnamed protein product [Symbiodinium sp. CCMP2592]|nr:unnamed protein product [Symbiodinium sp. CCMP2592]
MQWNMSAMPIVLADFADALASLLGLRMLRLASCSKACQHAFDHDPRIWGALLQYEINFRNIQNRDAVATSIFKRLPSTAKYLKLDLGNCCWKREGDIISDETFRLLVRSIPKSLHELSLMYMRPRGKVCSALGVDFARSLPSSLRKLELFVDLSREATLTLLGCLPRQLCELNMHVGDRLKWNAEAFRTLAEGFPQQLQILDLDLDADLREVTPLATQLAASQLTTLRLSLGSITGVEGLGALFAALPPSLEELQLLLDHIGVCDRSCEELGRSLRRCSRLRDLELYMGSCEVWRVLQAPCRSLKHLELSLQSLGQADAKQLSNFVNAADLGRLGLYLEGPQPEVRQALAALPVSLQGLDFSVWDRSVGDDALLSLARVIPPQLRDLHVSFMEGDYVPPESIKELLTRLPETLHTLSLSFEWSGFSQLTAFHFPAKLRTLSLSGGLDAAERPQQVPFIASLARELPRLGHLRRLSLNFEGCHWTAAEASQVLAASGPLVKKLDADFGTILFKEDTPDSWEALLGPFQERFGGTIRMPEGTDRDDTLYDAFGSSRESEATESGDEVD